MSVEAWKSNLESVIQKWEKKGPPAHVFEKKPIAMNGAVSNIGQSIGRRTKGSRHKSASRSRQDRIKENQYWASLEVNQTPKKFKLMSPVIKPPRAPYQMYQCKNCQKIDEKMVTLGKDSSSLSLFDVININEYQRRKSFLGIFATDFGFVYSRKMYAYPKIVPPIDNFECAANEVLQNGQTMEGVNDKQSIHFSQSEISSTYNRIVSYISSTLTRIVSWTLLKFFRRYFSSLCCHRQDIAVLEDITKKNIPIVYLPMHTSLLDFFVIYFTLFCNEIRLPFTFIPDSFCGSKINRAVLQGLGVSFIGDCSSRKSAKSEEGIIFKNYIEQLLRNKQSLLINIANRSLPSSADHDLVLNAVQNVIEYSTKDMNDDVFVVPVNVTYDMGLHRVSATVWNVFKLLWQGLEFDFNGMIHIRFGYPTSLKDFWNREPKFPALDWTNAKDLPSDATNSSHLLKVSSSLLAHAISDCHEIGVITCTSMLGFLFTTKHKREVPMEELQISFDWLAQEIVDAERCIGFFGATSDVVDYALTLLENQNLVQINTVKDADSKISRTVSVVQDNYKISELLVFGHQVTLVFALKSIVATSLMGISGGVNLLQVGQFLDDGISRNEILSLSKHLCDVMKLQCEIVPPCIDIVTSLSDIIDFFIATDTLTIPKEYHMKQSKSMALELDDEDGFDSWNDHELNVCYDISKSEEHRNLLLFLHSVIAPSLEKIWFTAACLSESPCEMEMTELDTANYVYKQFLEKVSKGHTFLAFGADVHSFQHITSLLLAFGLLGEVKNGQGERILKVPLSIEQRDKYIDFMRKLENCF